MADQDVLSYAFNRNLDESEILDMRSELFGDSDVLGFRDPDLVRAKYGEGEQTILLEFEPDPSETTPANVIQGEFGVVFVQNEQLWHVASVERVE